VSLFYWDMILCPFLYNVIMKKQYHKICPICGKEVLLTHWPAHWKSNHKGMDKIKYRDILLKITPKICSHPDCENKTKYQGDKHNYQDYCCIKCRNKDPKMRKSQSKKIKQIQQFRSKEEKLEIENKRKETNLKKYGVENASENLEIKQIMSKNIIKGFQNMDKEDFESFHRSQGISLSKTRQNETQEQKQKRVDNFERNFVEKYGVTNPLYINSIKEKVIRNMIKTNQKNGKYNCIEGVSTTKIMEKYEISRTTICNFINQNPNASLTEVFEFCEKFTDSFTNIEYIIHKSLNIKKYNKKPKNIEENKRPDFKLNDNIYLNVDGLYWHSELKNKDRMYHFKLRKIFEKNNLRIFQFRGDEVRKKINIVKSMINNLLNKSRCLYARKAKLRVISQKDANMFLENNHLMGKYNAKHVGLFYNGELVFIVSYKIIKDNLKIERLCSKINMNIVGGFGKCLKWLENNLQFNEIHYWVDLRYGTGDYLFNYNFKLSHETLGWKWTDGKNTFNRLRCRANMDSRNLSEREYANEFGWFKIYDAGQRLYVRAKK